MTKISILLPTYNGALYIEEAIKSVITQTYNDWELIILDDASTDDTGKISKEYAELDQRIIYVKNETNLRLVKNLNKGLSLAKGSFIARIDEDDIWTDIDKLKKQMEVFDKDNNCVLVGTYFEVVDEGGKHIRNITPPLDDKSIRKIILLYNPFGHSTVIFKKAEVMKIGGYDKAIKYGEDYDLWLRLGMVGAFAILPEITVRYLQRKSSMSGKHTKLKQIKFHTGLLIKYGKSYPNLLRSIAKLIYYAIKI